MRTPRKAKIIMIIIGVLIPMTLLVSRFTSQDRKVIITTDKTEYLRGENLTITINNQLKKSICFSSCYPYYLGIKRGKKWQSYNYEQCRKEDIIENCIDPRSTKSFEIKLPLIEKGNHQIAVPVCIGCQKGKPFYESTRFYSNEFLIK